MLKTLTPFITFASIFLLSFTACKKDDSDNNNSGNNSSRVIVSGYLNESPSIWYGASLKTLEEGDGIARALAKSGNDIYACGDDNTSFPRLACYWKNNVKTLIASNAVANSIFVENQNVYVAGVINDTLPFVSVNGIVEPLQLPSNTFYYDQDAYDILVNNGDVIVVGSVEIRAAAWFNNVLTYLSPPSSSGQASAVTIGPNGVYICGYYFDPTLPAFKACYWLNGSQFDISDGSNSCYAYDIAVSGNDVYICGAARDGSAPELRAVVWKNGTMQSLTGGQTEARARSISIKGNDIYVCGFEADQTSGNYIPKYWKNGEPVNLSSSDGEAYSILVN